MTPQISTPTTTGTTDTTVGATVIGASSGPVAQQSGTHLSGYRVSSFCTGGGCVEVGHAPDGAT